MKDWLLKYVDCKVLINLDERTGRLTHATEEFDKVGIVDVYRIPAVKHNIGISGCTRSHIEVIKLAKENKFKNILIFEDDVVFVDDASTFRDKIEKCFNQILKHKIKPDVLYLGARLVSPDDKSIELNNNYHKKIDDNLFRLGGCKTTHSYIVFESMYDKIIDSYESVDWDDINYWIGDNRMNIDYWYLTRLYHEGIKKYGNVDNRQFHPYGVYPSCTGQKSDYSDIQQKINIARDSLGMIDTWNSTLGSLNDK